MRVDIDPLVPIVTHNVPVVTPSKREQPAVIQQIERIMEEMRPYMITPFQPRPRNIAPLPPRPARPLPRPTRTTRLMPIPRPPLSDRTNLAPPRAPRRHPSRRPPRNPQGRTFGPREQRPNRPPSYRFTPPNEVYARLPSSFHVVDDGAHDGSWDAHYNDDPFLYDDNGDL